MAGPGMTGGTAAPQGPRPIRGPRVTGSWPQPRSLSHVSAPWRQTPIPAGYYNPTLDTEVGESERGAADATQEALTALTRGNSDYTLSKGEFQRKQQEGDTEIGRTRSIDEQNTAQALRRLGLSYSRLGTSQEEQQNAAGVLTGGAALQAASKRAANQTEQEQPIKQTEQRSLEDLSTKQRQLDEGTSRSLGNLALHQGPVSNSVLRLIGELDNPHARKQAQAELHNLEASPTTAGLLGGRTSQDVVSKLIKIQRENQIYKTNVEAEKAREAAEFGYVPESQPAGQHAAATHAGPRVVARRAQPITTSGGVQAPRSGGLTGGTRAPLPARRPGAALTGGTQAPRSRRRGY